MKKKAPTVRTITAEQKAAAVAALEAGGSATEIAAKHGVTPSGLYYWRRTLTKRKPAAGALVATPRPTPSIAAHSSRDAIIFLRKAKSELLAGIRSGTIDDLDNAHLLSLLALRSLQGS